MRSYANHFSLFLFPLSLSSLSSLGLWGAGALGLWGAGVAVGPAEAEGGHGGLPAGLPPVRELRGDERAGEVDVVVQPPEDLFRRSLPSVQRILRIREGARTRSRIEQL